VETGSLFYSHLEVDQRCFVADDGMISATLMAKIVTNHMDCARNCLFFCSNADLVHGENCNKLGFCVAVNAGSYQRNASPRVSYLL